MLNNDLITLEYSKEGFPIILDLKNNSIIYKEIKVSFYVIKEAFESGLDRIQLTEKLELVNINHFVTFGCLTLTENNVKQLIKLSWKQLNQYNKVGN